jgi:hypothetical protein
MLDLAIATQESRDSGLASRLAHLAHLCAETISR